MFIGILGGTFNPVHYGHLRTAAEVADRLELDRVLFVPVYLPSHKETGKMAPAHHRLRMTELGVGVDRRFSASAMEFARKGTSYTIDTLRQMREERYPGDDFFFLMGLDAFYAIHTWREVREFFNLTNVVVTTRPGFFMEEVDRVLKGPVFKGLGFKESGTRKAPGSRSFTAGHFPGSILILETAPVPVSSTEIREKISRGEEIAGLLPEEVEDYIMKNGIYQSKAPIS